MNNKNTSSSDKISAKIAELEIALISLKKAAELAVSEVKSLKKQCKKLVSKQEKKKNPNIVSKPHGFAIPSVVSKELCIFMGKEPGSLIARTEVTKELTEYITKHQLQNPENRRQILPDANLNGLLGKDAENVFLTHFTIQKFINRHFEKVVKPVV